MASVVGRRPMIAHIRQVGLLAMLAFTFGVLCSFGFGNTNARRLEIFTVLQDSSNISEFFLQPDVLEMPDIISKPNLSTSNMTTVLQDMEIDLESVDINDANSSEPKAEMGENVTLLSIADSRRQPKNADLCKRSRSWAACTRYSFCSWKKRPNEEYCELDIPFQPPPLPLEEYDPEFDYNPEVEDERTYFVYQPSGGLNNQRVLLEHALVICQLLNRTCVVPPAAAHTNYFEKYNIQPADTVTPMQRIFNFRELRKVVNVVSIPSGQTLMEWVNERHRARDGKWKTVLRSYKTFAPGQMKRWTEKDILKSYGNVKEKFLYFAKRSMWSAFNWQGSLSGFRQRVKGKLTIQLPHIYNISNKSSCSPQGLNVQRRNETGSHKFIRDDRCI